MAFWKDNFAFNKRQRNGIMVLLTLLVVAMVFLIVSNYLPVSSATVDFSQFKSDMAKVKFKHPDTSQQHATQVIPKSVSTLSVELNTADSSDFMQFPLVSPKVARTIIRFRDALGGYYSKKQLLEVYGMDTACYYSMAANITLDTSNIEKLDINKATEKAMAHHPYIHKILAKAIFDYRKENGEFKDIKDIMKVQGVDKDLYSKLSPYLSITK